MGTEVPILLVQKQVLESEMTALRSQSAYKDEPGSEPRLFGTNAPSLNVCALLSKWLLRNLTVRKTGSRESCSAFKGLAGSWEERSFFWVTGPIASIPSLLFCRQFLWCVIVSCTDGDLSGDTCEIRGQGSSFQLH